MAEPDNNGKHRSGKGVKAGRAGEPAREAPDIEQARDGKHRCGTGPAPIHLIQPRLVGPLLR